jgi:hypothetical protein
VGNNYFVSCLTSIPAITTSENYTPVRAMNRLQELREIRDSGRDKFLLFEHDTGGFVVMRTTYGAFVVEIYEPTVSIDL